MTGKPEPMLSKILRPGGMAANSLIFECDGIKLELDAFKDNVELSYKIRGTDGKIVFAPQDSSAMAALLRAVADDLEKL